MPALAAARNNLEAVLVNAVAACQYDPEAWARFAWDWGQGELADEELREWQADAFATIKAHISDPEKRFLPCQVARASGHGIGKSAWFGMLSNWAMSCFPNCKIVTTANTESQLRTKTSPEIAKWFKSSITSHWFDINTMSISSVDPECKTSWRQDFVTWSEHNTEAFAGLHNKGNIIILVFDEASKIADKVWEVAEGALTDENTIIIWVVFGNPTQNTGRFRECFRKFRHRWYTKQIDSRTVKGTNKKKIDQWLEDYGEDSDFFKVRVRGMFPSASVNQFISTEDVDNAVARAVALREHEYSFAPRIIGVDPAWTGDDEFVIYFRQGNYTKRLATYARNDNDIVMASHVKRFEDELKADAVFIDGGHGTGIVSAGRTWGRNWQLVWFAEKSADEACLNKRVEMWKLMRKWLKEGGVIDPADEVLYQDLIGPELVSRMDGKLQLEAKDDMKARGVPSPNRADALALTFAHPVVRDDYGGSGNRQAVTDYNRHG